MRWLAAGLRVLMVAAGLTVLVYAARESAVWKSWDAEKLAALGSGEVKNERVISLKKLFDSETGAAVRADVGRVAVLGGRDISSHGTQFSSQIYLDWFLAPESKGAELIFEPETAAEYPWVFAWWNAGRTLKKAGVEFEEVWREDRVYLALLRI